MSKFNVGDKVRIKNDLKLGIFYSDCYVVQPMMKYLGKTATITGVDKGLMKDEYLLDIDNEDHCWNDEMLEPVETIKEDEKLEMINNPIHYNSCGEYETIKKMELLFGKEAVLTWARLTAFKYRDRMEFKENKDQDTAKMDWYLKYIEDNE